MQNGGNIALNINQPQQKIYKMYALGANFHTFGLPWVYITGQFCGI